VNYVFKNFHTKSLVQKNDQVLHKPGTVARRTNNIVGRNEFLVMAISLHIFPSSPISMLKDETEKSCPSPGTTHRSCIREVVELRVASCELLKGKETPPIIRYEIGRVQEPVRAKR
jgi:hypothetical protein